MFIAAILIIAQIWKQPKDAAVDEQISKMRTICTLEHYLGTKIEWREGGRPEKDGSVHSVLAVQM